jgi:hypothetical protein
MLLHDFLGLSLMINQYKSEEQPTGPLTYFDSVQVGKWKPPYISWVLYFFLLVNKRKYVGKQKKLE